MKIKKIDHIVLTVKDIDVSVKFYSSVLGMIKEKFGNGRIALKFGSQKINLHQYGKEFEPKALIPQPGSEDLCFISETPINEVVKHIEKQSVKIIEGPIERTGAQGKILSIYFRDPDGNLLEISNYLSNL
ncbi:MAG: VOC family protein [Gammaproteobacteria bacterium]|nr:VOC family protein [Gammaproteobacteria bacterium]